MFKKNKNARRKELEDKILSLRKLYEEGRIKKTDYLLKEIALLNELKRYVNLADRMKLNVAIGLIKKELQKGD